MKVPKYFKAQHQQVKCIKCYIPQNKAKISSGVTAKIDFFPYIQSLLVKLDGYTLDTTEQIISIFLPTISWQWKLN